MSERAKQADLIGISQSAAQLSDLQTLSGHAGAGEQRKRLEWFTSFFIAIMHCRCTRALVVN